MEERDGRDGTMKEQESIIQDIVENVFLVSCWNSDRDKAFKFWSIPNVGHVKISIFIEGESLIIELYVGGVGRRYSPEENKWTYELFNPNSIKEAREKLAEVYCICRKLHDNPNSQQDWWK